MSIPCQCLDPVWQWAGLQQQLAQQWVPLGTWPPVSQRQQSVGKEGGVFQSATAG